MGQLEKRMLQGGGVTGKSLRGVCVCAVLTSVVLPPFTATVPGAGVVTVTESNLLDYPGLNFYRKENEPDTLRSWQAGVPKEVERHRRKKLRVSVRRIEWTLDENRFTPDIPEHPVVLDGPEETIDLVPYGATMLRLSVFPEVPAVRSMS